MMGGPPRIPRVINRCSTTPVLDLTENDEKFGDGTTENVADDLSDRETD